MFSSQMPRQSVRLDWAKGLLNFRNYYRKTINILNVPKQTPASSTCASSGCTSCTSCVMYIFWMCMNLCCGKSLLETFSDVVISVNCDLDLHLRNSIINMQSSTHNQLSSPRLFDVFKYTWCKNGHVDEKSVHFKNPVE